MEMLETVSTQAVVSRLFQVFVGSILYLYVVAKLVGPEHKKAWFHKRQKYTFFNRRGVFGEDINFGYPTCWQGILVFLAVYVVIFGLGYWYIFVHAY